MFTGGGYEILLSLSDEECTVVNSHAPSAHSDENA